MTHNRFDFFRGPARAMLAVALIVAAFAARADDIRAVVVGGGPDLEHNQVAIESNVRYLLRLLPKDSTKTVLFADGDRKSATVLYEERTRELKPAERIVALAVDGREAAHPAALKYRAPEIAQIDGPSRKAAVAAVFGRLAQKESSTDPLLLYFTGHGSPARDQNLENNVYDLWGDGTLSVRELAAHVARLPATQPVTLVMVQCFSGAFGNILFENGDPEGAPVSRDVAGFFATVKERMAAGCTPAVDESEYHDFTSYFFAALTGRDRVGRPVTGADYDGDGRVTMDEAFCYALIHDTSIDIPVCTSDVYLRRAVRTPDAQVFKTPYSEVTQWATPGQLAALEALAGALRYTGEDRGAIAYGHFLNDGGGAVGDGSYASERRTYGRARRAAMVTLTGRFPGLRDRSGAGYDTARKQAVDYVAAHLDEPAYRDLLKADDDFAHAEDEDYRAELREAQEVRFVRLFKSVVLAHTLRASGDVASRRELERIVASERRPLFPASAVASRR